MSLTATPGPHRMATNKKPRFPGAFCISLVLVGSLIDGGGGGGPPLYSAGPPPALAARGPGLTRSTRSPGTSLVQFRDAGEECPPHPFGALSRFDSPKVV